MPQDTSKIDNKNLTTKYEKCITMEQIFLVAKELAERGDGAGFIYIASVYYERGDKALAFKYFNEAEKLGINSKEFIEILDGINI